MKLTLLTFRKLFVLSLTFLMVGFAWSFLGCGNDDDDSNEEHEHVSDDHTHADSDDEHTHADVGELQKMTVNGNFMVILQTAEQLHQGQNTLTVHLENDKGEHVTGAALEVTPWMPEHGHGSSGVAVITEEADGNYKVDNIVFQMMGMWDLTVKVTANSISDEAKFIFDIK